MRWLSAPNFSGKSCAVPLLLARSPMKIDMLRFAVGDDDALWSSIWIAFGGANGRSDYYVSVRGQTGAVKVSLHALGACQIAFDKESGYWDRLVASGLAPTADRAITSWQRTPTPEMGMCHALSIFFPTDLMRLRRPHPRRKPGKKLFLLEPAPPGHAVEWGFFYSRQHPQEFLANLRSAGVPVGFVELPSGEYVTNVARHVPFDATVIPAFAAWPNGRPLTRQLPASGETLRGLSAFVCNEPKVGQVGQIVQITGLELRR